MMSENTVKGNKKPNTGGSEYNALQFMIQNAMSGISTAIPVQVQAVSGLFVDVLPLVSSVDGYGKAVEPTTLFHLPVFRYHAGVGAVILDPVVGDKGLAVFAQADSSNVQTGTDKPQQPGSFRKHSMSDGFFINGFYKTAPSVFIEIKQDGHIIIEAPAGITVNSPNASFSGTMNITGDCTIGGKSFLEHIHTGDSGGTTSPPL
jgi:hypothetical protein